jgi:arylsulfatase A
LYWAINQPHYPLQGRAKWREHYKHLPSPRNMYAASVSSLDEMVGQVVAKVKALGLLENTIIVLQSDHGHSTEDRAFSGGGNAGPYRGAKFSLFEGGMHVVGMISHPGTLPANQVRDQFVTGCDWMPTLAELTGVELPKRKLDGKGITSILKSSDATSPHESWHWQLGQQWAVRDGTWKLIGNPRDTSNKAPVAGKYFLSDLSKDVSEMVDVSAKEPERLKRMIVMHERWVVDVKDRS